MRSQFRGIVIRESRRLRLLFVIDDTPLTTYLCQQKTNKTKP